MPASTSSDSSPAIDPATLVRAILKRQGGRTSNLRLMKLAYLAEVRYAFATGHRLTNAEWRSWKFGPDSREIAFAARGLPADQATISQQEVFGKMATYYSPGPAAEPTLEPGIARLLDDLLAVYGKEDTTLVLSAAYRSTPFTETSASRLIPLEAWGKAVRGALAGPAIAGHITEAIAAPRQRFANWRDLVEFLAVMRGSVEAAN